MNWLRRLVERNSVDDTIRVLAVQPKSEDRTTLTQIAEKAGWYLDFAETLEAARYWLQRNRAAVVVYDRDLADGDWRKALETFTAKGTACPVVLKSPVIDDQLWQEVIQRGGYDVITTPLNEQRVVRTVEFAWSTRKRS